MSEEKEILEAEIKPYQYYEQQMIRKIHHFYINQVVEQPTHYVHMIHIIKTANPEDIIHIHLNTPGGVLDTGVQLVNAMRSTEAHCVCSLEAKANSLGTLIFLAADEFIVHDNCVMMFHNYSGGVFGKAHEQVAELEATNKWFNAIAYDIYVPFLTDDEFNRIVEGGDLWVHSDEIRERLTNMVQMMEAERLANEIQSDSIPNEKTAPKKKSSKKKSSKKKTTRKKSTKKKS